MDNKIKENNNKMTIIINDSVNETPKEFQVP